jgi:hypothetical protein
MVVIWLLGYAPFQTSRALRVVLSSPVDRRAGMLLITKKQPNRKKKRTGIFIYCEVDLRTRLKRVARSGGQTLSGYVLACLRPQLERDERRVMKSRRVR